MKPDNHEDTAACSHISRILARISDKWSLLIVRVLGHGPLRFNALRREVGEISQKVLASTLRELEENGFVSRTVMHPPQRKSSMLSQILDENSLIPFAASLSGLWQIRHAWMRRARSTPSVVTLSDMLCLSEIGRERLLRIRRSHWPIEPVASEAMLIRDRRPPDRLEQETSYSWMRIPDTEDRSIALSNS